MNKVYIPFRIPREDLASFIDDARELGVQRPERDHPAQRSRAEDG